MILASPDEGEVLSARVAQRPIRRRAQSLFGLEEKSDADQRI